ATGHSARDVYRMLGEVGVKIEAKGLAIGVRLEHPQALIDRLQYHSQAGRGDYLPAAEYNYVAQVDGRGVYSFCMCPGGVIVPSASDENQSAVNGMSASARASEWANSGMVVEVRPGDFPEFSCYKEYEMLELQEMLEKDFYDAAGQSMKAPAQRMLDFVNKKVSSSLPKSSYAPGLLSLPVHFLLPKEIACRLQEGFKIFGKRSKGFLTNEATVIGLESRTSSPIRVPRDKETLCHIEIEGLYPAGEGAGYAGGIVSAAIDGERCVEAYYNTLKN
ncbi:MAG: FAD-binding protein, partial [Muribaculaceae bacterium]|nr:FAD-binding protein [Muribaculaceae bacterium]